MVWVAYTLCITHACMHVRTSPVHMCTLLEHQSCQVLGVTVELSTIINA
jgi:hypothetical protein